jgi:hypothetical protein
MSHNLLQVKLTQSNAILRHIARKNNLAGSSLQEQASADMCADQVPCDPDPGADQVSLDPDPSKDQGYKTMIRIRLLTRCP